MTASRFALLMLFAPTLFPGRALGAAPVAEQTPGIRTESLVALLDLLDAVAAANPDAGSVSAELAAMDPIAQRARLAALAKRNAADPAVAARLDSWLATPARVIYFRRFQNVTPEHARASILALPYAETPAPGGLAAAWFALLPRRHDVRAQIERLAPTLDLARCSQAARRWLPPGVEGVPELHLIWDANAGSYTAEGRAFYNLYQGEGATALRSDDMEGVIAHELHHILARPLLDATRGADDQGDWRRVRLRRLLREMVSEGAALHCNPPAGFKAALWNDPQVRAALVADLQGVWLALADGVMTEPEYEAWYRDSFHGRPRKLLEEYLRRVEPAEVDALTRAHATDRPDLVHALGWIMASTVSGHGQHPAAIHELLSDPASLLVRYDSALTEPDPRLRLDPRVVRVP